MGQVNGKYVVISKGLKAYAEKAGKLVAQFCHFTLTKIDRGLNEVADEFAKIALGETHNSLGIFVETQAAPEPMFPLHPSNPDAYTWVDELRDFISSDVLPEEKTKEKEI